MRGPLDVRLRYRLWCIPRYPKWQNKPPESIFLTAVRTSSQDFSGNSTLSCKRCLSFWVKIFGYYSVRHILSMICSQNIVNFIWSESFKAINVNRTCWQQVDIIFWDCFNIWNTFNNNVAICTAWDCILVSGRCCVCVMIMQNIINCFFFSCSFYEADSMIWMRRCRQLF